MTKIPFKVALFDNYTDENGNEVEGPETNPYEITGGSTGKGWDIFNNILTGAGMIGDTFGQIRNSLTGASPDQLANISANEQAQAKQTKSIMYIAGGLILVILVVLIVKSKSQ